MTDNRDTLECILADIEDRPNLSVFFNRLEEDLRFQALFMLHRQDLFMTSDNSVLPVLIWSSVDPEQGMDESPVLFIFRELNSARFRRAYRAFPFLPEKQPEELKDLLTYGTFTLIRENDDIKRRITMAEFSYAEMKRVLGDYSNFAKKFDKIIRESDDPYMQRLKEAQAATAKRRYNKLLSRPLQFLESLVDMMPNLYLEIHTDASSHMGFLLEKSILRLEDYKQVLTDLYALGLVVRQDSVYRCDKCADEPQILTSSSKIGPNRMNINCPRCGQPMQSSAILWLDDVLKDCLVWREGLLTVAIACLMKKNGIAYKSFVSDGIYEYDFIGETPEDKFLVECKVHRLPSSERAVKGSIDKDLRQVSEHSQALGASSAIVISNYDLEGYEDLVEKGTEKYDIDLISFSDAPEYFELLSQR